MSNPSSLHVSPADWLDAPAPVLAVRETQEGADEERPGLLKSAVAPESHGFAADWVLMAEMEAFGERADAVTAASTTPAETSSTSDSAARSFDAADSSQSGDAFAAEAFSPCVMPLPDGERLDGRWSKDHPDRVPSDPVVAAIVVIDDPVPESPNPWTSVREELRDESGALTGYRDVLSYGDSSWFSEYDANGSFVASGFESPSGSGRTVREVLRDDSGQMVAYRDISEYRDALGNWSTGTRETLVDASGSPTGYRDIGSGGGGEYGYSSSNEYDAGFNLLASTYSDSTGFNFTTVRVDLTDDAGRPAGWRLETTGGAPGYSFERVETYGPDRLLYASTYSDSNGATSFYSQVNNFDEWGNPAGYTITSSGSYGGNAWGNTVIYDASGNYLGGESWSTETSPTDAGADLETGSAKPVDTSAPPGDLGDDTPPDGVPPDPDSRPAPQKIVCWLDPPDSVDLRQPEPEEPQIAVCWQAVSPDGTEEPPFATDRDSAPPVTLVGVAEFSSDEPLAA